MTFLVEKKDSIKLYADFYLKQGESLNIYGDSYVGKTTFCFYVIKRNKEKKIAYVASEPLDPCYRNKLESLAKHIYELPCINIKRIKELISEIPMDLIIIDSLTALEYIEQKKDLADFFKTIEDKNINSIVVSQIRNYKEKKSYEHSKLLNFCAYKAEIKKHDGFFIVDSNKIDFNEIW